MFHNIFKSNKQRKGNKIPLIIADIHEKNSLIISELKSLEEVRLEIKSLKIADYIIGNLAIERKTISDLISSMINKRLIQQLFQLKKYKKTLLIIEGNIDEIYKKNNVSKALRGLIVSIITKHQIPIIFSMDYKDTSQYFIMIAKQFLKLKNPISLHSHIPKTIKEQKKYILESFPGIGPKSSEKLLNKFETLEKIFNANEEELKKILKNKSDGFKSLLNS